MGVERCEDSTIGGQRKGRKQPIALDVAEIYNFIFLIITWSIKVQPENLF